MFDDDYHYSPYIDDYKYLKEMELDDKYPFCKIDAEENKNIEKSV